MADPISEYTVRDYSAVDEQVKQIAEREKIVTQKLQLQNLKRAIFLGCVCLLAFGLFIFICALAYRVAFPPEPKIIEKTEIVEKIIEPQKIIIQTPAGSVTGNQPTDVFSSGNADLGKFFGESGGSSTSPSAVDTTSSSSKNNETKNSQTVTSASSGLKRTVHTFTNVSATEFSFDSVTTGWRWKKVNDKKPETQYCYAERRKFGKKEVYDLANILSPEGAVIKLKNDSSNELSNDVWNKLTAKCRWFNQ